MSAESKIEWTDHTFNPWWGCQRVSPGCEHCYAETFSKRLGLKVWGPASSGTPRRFFGDKHWAEPLKWNRAAERAGERHRVFCASMGDLFEDRPDLAPHRARLYALIRETMHLDWLLLTKRPENIRRLWREAAIDAFNGADSFGPFGNIWLGTTAEDQPRADERIPHLIACRDLSPVLFVSYEPALGASDFAPWLPLVFRPPAVPAPGFTLDRNTLDWIIVGGESGPGARPFDLAWALSTIRACREAGVPVFVKQLGAVPYSDEWLTGIGKFRDRKGGDPAEWSEELRAREWPEARTA